MRVLTGALTLVVSGLIGLYLDVGLGISYPVVYWFLGCLGGLLAMR